MSIDRPLPPLARTLLLLGASAFLPMCGSDSHHHASPDAGAVSDSGSPPASADGSIDASQVGNDSGATDAAAGDSGTEVPSDASTDASTDAGTTPPAAAWHLWIMESTTNHLYGYAPDQLTATNGPAPEIDIALGDKLNSLHFDAQGNLWGTTLDTTVVQYAAKDLKQSGTASAAIKFTETGTGNVLYVAFDKTGNLWTTGYNGHTINRYDASLLSTLTATSPAQTAPFHFTSSAPSEVAFDAAGNLYTTVNPGGGRANAARFDAAQLVGTGSDSDPAAALLANVTFYASTFFSPTGQLLFSCDADNLYRLSAAQVAAMGNANGNMAAETVFTITNLGAGWGVYDPNGVLWVSGRKDHFVAISAADLAMTGAVTVSAPAVTIRAPVTNAGASFTSMAIH